MTGEQFMEKVIQLYVEARKPSFYHPKIRRGRSHSIPSKVEDLSKEGFDVIKTKHLPEPNKENIEYLKTKAEKMRHQFTID